MILTHADCISFEVRYVSLLILRFDMSVYWSGFPTWYKFESFNIVEISSHASAIKIFPKCYLQKYYIFTRVWRRLVSSRSILTFSELFAECLKK